MILPPLLFSNNKHGRVVRLQRFLTRPGSSLPGMLFDELPAAFDVFAHQHAEHALGFAGFFQRDAQQHALAGVERGFPELFAVHLAQPFEAADLHAVLGEAEDLREDLRDAGDVDRLCRR